MAYDATVSITSQVRDWVIGNYTIGQKFTSLEVAEAMGIYTSMGASGVSAALSAAADRWGAIKRVSVMGRVITYELVDIESWKASAVVTGGPTRNRPAGYTRKPSDLPKLEPDMFVHSSTEPSSELTLSQKLVNLAIEIDVLERRPIKELVDYTTAELLEELVRRNT